VFLSSCLHHPTCPRRLAGGTIAPQQERGRSHPASTEPTSNVSSQRLQLDETLELVGTVEEAEQGADGQPRSSAHLSLTLISEYRLPPVTTPRSLRNNFRSWLSRRIARLVRNVC